MAKKSLIIIAFLSTLILLTGCVPVSKEDITKVANESSNRGQEIFYQFMKNGNYSINDISEFNVENEQLAFVLKKTIDYKNTLSFENEEIVFTQLLKIPTNSTNNKEEDIYNLLSDYSLDDKYNLELKRKLNETFKNKKDSTFSIKIDEEKMLKKIKITGFSDKYINIKSRLTVDLKEKETSGFEVQNDNWKMHK